MHFSVISHISYLGWDGFLQMHVHRSGLVQHQLIVFVAMLHRENSKISNNMDCLILQQGTPIIVAMMMREFYICLTMYVEIYRTIFYL